MCRYFLACIAFFLGFTAHATLNNHDQPPPEYENSQDINGLLYKLNNKNFIKLPGEHEPLEIIAINQDVVFTLDKLQSRDQISGTGQIDRSKKTANLYWIDYVGLAKLIGTWRNENHKMQFYNYNSAKFSVQHYEEAIEMDPLAMILFPQFQAAKFNYNLVPTDSDEWIMFISGEEKSFLSSLKFQNNKAFFKLIDSETGKVKFSTILYKE